MLSRKKTILGFLKRYCSINFLLIFQVLNTRTMKQVPNFEVEAFFVLIQTSCLQISCLKINCPKSTAKNQLPKIICFAISYRRHCWFFFVNIFCLFGKTNEFSIMIFSIDSCFFLVKVHKSQEQFFLKLYCPKN